MKLRALIRLKPGVLDAQGRAIENALRDLGHTQVTGIRTGKLVELDLAETDPERARALAREICEKLLANPVIETYDLI